MNDICYMLAVDIGASSGRHILGSLRSGKIELEEIYRFENRIAESDGKLTWDIDSLCAEVLNGLRKCAELGKIPQTVAIDTWGVDYVLLDAQDNPILPVYCYRDARTEPVIAEIESIIPYREIYARTGIQRQPFNTMYQLYCDKKSGRLADAASMLLLPNYLMKVLTGISETEYTIASTTGLLDAASKTWDTELIHRLGLPENLFGRIRMPGEAQGRFSDEIAAALGFSATVVHAACHDTGSAVAACPIDDETLYISSGTWSLVGTENNVPILSEPAFRANLTNEGGVEGRYRVLKNVMGMWMLQNIKRELENKYSYNDLEKMAKNSSFEATFDCNDPSLYAPKSMIGAIRALLGGDVPLEDLLSSVYRSLAQSYRTAADELEVACGKKIGSILIVGGGSKDRYLNELTARISGRMVRTGITEATALGNILTQLMYLNRCPLSEAREFVKRSFDITAYTA